MKGEDDGDIVRWLEPYKSDEKFTFGFGSPVSYPALMPGRVVIRNHERQGKWIEMSVRQVVSLRLARKEKNLLPEGGFWFATRRGGALEAGGFGPW